MSGWVWCTGWMLAGWWADGLVGFVSGWVWVNKWGYNCATRAMLSLMCASFNPRTCMALPAGNVGGEEEVEAVRQVAAAIQAGCEGFADFLAAVEQRHKAELAQQAQQQAGNGASNTDSAGSGGGEQEGQAQQQRQRLGEALTAAVREMDAMDWLVPPMLQPR